MLHRVISETISNIKIINVYAQFNRDIVFVLCNNLTNLPSRLGL